MAVRKHGTGTAATVATVSNLGSAGAEDVNQPDAAGVEVVSVAGAEPIYCTFDGTTPTVRGDDTYVVQAGGSLRIPVRGEPPVTVKMISAADFTYALEVITQ
jgi:hypothetical protein